MAASLSCRWVVEIEEVPAVEPKQRYDELKATTSFAPIWGAIT